MEMSRYSVVALVVVIVALSVLGTMTIVLNSEQQVIDKGANDKGGSMPAIEEPRSLDAHVTLNIIDPERGDTR